MCSSVQVLMIPLFLSVFGSYNTVFDGYKYYLSPCSTVQWQKLAVACWSLYTNKTVGRFCSHPLSLPVFGPYHGRLLH